jgi:hypothetical protein
MLSVPAVSFSAFAEDAAESLPLVSALPSAADVMLRLLSFVHGRPVVLAP